jgi:c-di-GMP-related signal transduction protein
MDVFVARQPIFDRELRLIGYELLFRSGPQSIAYDGAEEGLSTIHVIANTLFAIGHENILCGKLGFINFGRGLLVDGWRPLLPKEGTVVELLETVEPDSDVLQACKRLREQGYTIALDDFVCHPRFEPLTRFADILKVDVQSTCRDSQSGLLKKYQPQGIKMLAEKVETQEEFDWSLKAGFDYFQGYFFARPTIVRGKQIPTGKLACLRLLLEAQKRNLDFDYLEMRISEDVSLSYKLLRYVNAAVFRRLTEIHTIGQALARLGEDEVRRWIAIAVLPRLAADKPNELVTHSILRARFCETVARVADIKEADDAFLVGMFSQLDALLDRPLELALAEVSLAPMIIDVLLDRASANNELANVYRMVRHYQSGEWDLVEGIARLLKIPDSLVGQSYLESVRWTNQVLAA